MSGNSIRKIKSGLNWHPYNRQFTEYNGAIVFNNLDSALLFPFISIGDIDTQIKLPIILNDKERIAGIRFINSEVFIVATTLGRIMLTAKDGKILDEIKAKGTGFLFCCTLSKDLHHFVVSFNEKEKEHGTYCQRELFWISIDKDPNWNIEIQGRLDLTGLGTIKRMCFCVPKGTTQLLLFAAQRSDSKRLVKTFYLSDEKKIIEIKDLVNIPGLSGTYGVEEINGNIYSVDRYGYVTKIYFLEEVQSALEF